MSATRLSAIVLRWHNSPYMAQKIEREAVAAGWVSPEAARQAKADLENAREAGKGYRQRAEKAEAELSELRSTLHIMTAQRDDAQATVARVEALESAWRGRPARDNARWELGQALGPKS